MITNPSRRLDLDDGVLGNQWSPERRAQANLLAVHTFTDSTEGISSKDRKIRRWGVSYRGISSLVAALDVLIIIASATISGLAYHMVAYGDRGDVTRDIAVSVFVSAFFVFVTHLRKLYDPTQLLIWNSQLQNVLLLWGCSFVFLGGLVFSLGASKEASRGAILWFAVSGGIGLLIPRLFWRAFIERALAAGSLPGRKV